MTKIATPVSHLFTEESQAEQIIRVSDCLECRDQSLSFSFPGQELFHSNIELIHQWTAKELEHIYQIKKTKPDLKLLTFHAAVCTQQYTEKDAVAYCKPEDVELPETMLAHAKTNVRAIRKIIGHDIILGLENNNYYPTNAYQTVTDPVFISQVVYENDLAFLFDIAHAQITSHNKGVSYEEYKRGLPFDRLIQLHISEHGFNSKGWAYDLHDAPDDVWSEVQKLLNTYTVPYVTIEYYKDTNKLLAVLGRLKKLCHG